MSKNSEWGELPPENDVLGDAADDKPLESEEDAQRAEYMAQPAPFGRFKNGKPRKTPPGGKKSSNKQAKKSARGGKAGYEEGINGVFQMASFGLAMTGSNNKAMLADSLAIVEHGPNIAAALDMLAAERPEVAAVLDRVLAVGPYGALIAAVAPLVLQVVSNHGIKLPGAVGPEEYIAQATAKYGPTAAAGTE